MSFHVSSQCVSCELKFFTGKLGMLSLHLEVGVTVLLSGMCTFAKEAMNVFLPVYNIFLYICMATSYRHKKH